MESPNSLKKKNSSRTVAKLNNLILKKNQETFGFQCRSKGQARIKKMGIYIYIKFND